MLVLLFSIFSESNQALILFFQINNTQVLKNIHYSCYYLVYSLHIIRFSQRVYTMSSLFTRQLSFARVSGSHVIRSYFQGVDLGNRNKDAIDKVCHNLLKARADPFHGHRKERLPDSEQKKVSSYHTRHTHLYCFSLVFRIVYENCSVLQFTFPIISII